MNIEDTIWGETDPDMGVTNTTAAVSMRNDQSLNVSFKEGCY